MAVQKLRVCPVDRTSGDRQAIGSKQSTFKVFCSDSVRVLSYVKWALGKKQSILCKGKQASTLL